MGLEVAVSFSDLKINCAFKIIVLAGFLDLGNSNMDKHNLGYRITVLLAKIKKKLALPNFLGRHYNLFG